MSTKVNGVARIATTTVHSAKIEDGRLHWEQHIIPAMKRAQGFRHLYVLGDDKTNRVTTISLWDSEADAEAWEKSEVQQALRSGLSSAVTSMPTPEVFHIKLEA